MQLVSAEIENYCREHTTTLPPVFDRLRDETHAKLKYPEMQVGLLEGRFLSLLVGITGAKRILEIGTFSGFSALSMAAALPPDGKIITCDIDPLATSIAQKYWQEARLQHKIELRLGAAQETLSNLEGPFDIVFIDADKIGYEFYWNRALELLRKNGLVIVDNVLWSGRVLNPLENNDFQIVNFNQMAIRDSRVEQVMLPVRDGILLARKL